jgi:hypothetical protein
MITSPQDKGWGSSWSRRGERLRERGFYWSRRGYWSNRWQVCCMGGSLAGCYGGPGCKNREEGGEVGFLQRWFACGGSCRVVGRSGG